MVLAPSNTINLDRLLAEIRACARSLKPGSADAEATGKIFKAFHAIHSLALVVGFGDLALFTNQLEELAAHLREGMVVVTEPLPGILVAATDQVKLLLEAAQGGPPIDFSLQAALLEAVFQIAGPSVPMRKARELEAEASVQDAIVFRCTESVPAG